jgi:hypothetical protein
MACEVIDSFLSSKELGGEAEVLVSNVERDTREASKDDCNKKPINIRQRGRGFKKPKLIG